MTATVDILVRTAHDPDPVILPVSVALIRFESHTAAAGVGGTED